jgi:hypothetical protein
VKLPIKFFSCLVNNEVIIFIKMEIKSPGLRQGLGYESIESVFSFFDDLEKRFVGIFFIQFGEGKRPGCAQYK